MNSYRLTMLDFEPGVNRPKVVELGTREARNGIAALEAFVAERGVAEHYTRDGRKRLVGLGCPTLTADLVRELEL
jgi:hypothetical protein